MLHIPSHDLWAATCCNMLQHATLQLTAFALTPWFCPWSSSAYREGNPRPAPDDTQRCTTMLINVQCWYQCLSAYQCFWFQITRALLRRRLVRQCLAFCPPRTSEYGWWMMVDVMSKLFPKRSSQERKKPNRFHVIRIHQAALKINISWYIDRSNQEL